MQPEKINKGIGTPQPRVLDMGRNNESSPRGTTNQIFLRKSQATRLRNSGYSHTLKRALDGVCAHKPAAYLSSCPNLHTWTHTVSCDFPSVSMHSSTLNL